MDIPEHQKRRIREDINDLFKKVTPIGHKWDSQRTEDDRLVGTGFFYHSQYTTPVDYQYDPSKYPPFGPYLVTNKHIVKGEPTPEHLTIYLRDRDTLLNPTRFKIPVFDQSGNANWFEHPEVDADVVLFLLDWSLKFPFTFRRALIPQEENEVSGGDLASIIGYPRDLPEFKHFPIIRNGLISNPYGVALQTTNHFYFDARLQNKMSGSPVVAMPQKYLPPEEIEIMFPEKKEDTINPEEWQINRPLDWESTRPYLLGVHSEEQIDQHQSMEEMRERLSAMEGEGQDRLHAKVETLLDQIEHETGLNVAWHSRLIEEIRQISDIKDDDAVRPKNISAS